MRAFLEEAVLHIQKSYEDLSSCVLILPSKRAGGFLREYLRKQSPKTTFAPRIISIEEFIEELSGLHIVSSEELLIKSYTAYLETERITEKEDFQSFSTWATALLNDFSEIDRYLVPQKNFFDYLSSIKTLEKWGVTEDQTPLIKNYLNFWSHLSDFYNRLNEILLAEQKGYQGMVYRKAAEDIEHYMAHTSDTAHIFIGFNALNTSEQHIIQALLETESNEILWDLDRYFYNDKDHSASYFIRNYLHEWKYYNKNEKPVFSNLYKDEKTITIVEASSTISEVKYVGNLLANYSQEQLNKTAVVLADEALLIPLLYSLPQNVTQANVTMGLPLQRFDTTTFFELLLKLHLKPAGQFYYKPIEELLSHPFLSTILPETELLILKISQQNYTYLTLEKLLVLLGKDTNPILETLFGNWDGTVTNAIIRCRTLLEKVMRTTGKTVEKLVWLKLDEVFLKIQQLTKTHTYLNSMETLYSLFIELSHTLSIDFEGDAYQGLQIMGVLETRGLDFENVIMLTVNEGVLPTGKSTSSFVTYDLKKQFGLPLYTEKDAVYTYHFYRLLQRTKSITLLYNSFSSGLNSGEKSRYLLQLEIEKPAAHHLTFETIATSVTPVIPSKKEITKTPEIMERLAEIGGRYFSPSALTSYVRNPLEFYTRKILKINETVVLEETVAYNTLGTIVHDALEFLYTPFVATYLTSEALTDTKSLVDEAVRNEFKKYFEEAAFQKGKNLIIFEVAKRYVSNLIDLDLSELKNGNRIKIIQLEADLKTRLDIPELEQPIFLGGMVDRIDLYNDEIRVIDYKTGNVQRNELALSEWNQLTEDYKYSKAFQVLAYSLLIHKELGIQQMKAGVISFKNLNSGFLSFSKKEGRSKQNSIDNELLEEFSLQLKKLIMELFDTSTPFTEKEIPT